MNLKTSTLLGLTFFLIAVSGCMQNAQTGLQIGLVKPVPLIEAADHTLYIGSCVKQEGLENKSKCVFDPSASSRAQGRGIAYGYSGYNGYAGYYDPYSAYYNQYNTYYYYNLQYFNQQSFCSAWDWNYDCYGSFGYPVNQYGTQSPTTYQYQYQYQYSYQNGYNDQYCLYNYSNPTCWQNYYSASSLPVTQPTPLPAQPTNPYPTPTPTPLPSPSNPSTVQVPCVGGPIGPSFAFRSATSAQQCAAKVASYSNSCKQNVKLSQCTANWYQVDAVTASACSCAPNKPYVGHW